MFSKSPTRPSKVNLSTPKQITSIKLKEALIRQEKKEDFLSNYKESGCLIFR